MKNKNIHVSASFASVLILRSLPTLNINASEIDQATILVDPVFSYSKKKVENNKNVYFMHSSLGKKWQYANNYFLSVSKGGINVSFGYGPLVFLIQKKDQVDIQSLVTIAKKVN